MKLLVIPLAYSNKDVVVLSLVASSSRHCGNHASHFYGVLADKENARNMENYLAIWSHNKELSGRSDPRSPSPAYSNGDVVVFSVTLQHLDLSFNNFSGDFSRLCLCSNLTFFSLTTRTRRFSETVLASLLVNNLLNDSKKLVEFQRFTGISLDSSDNALL
ncbi:hypothetical protein Bca4012_063772 [Brassica carinata]|uniref:Uncharacterized protein n=1 Tax=Brassica carinata TaxID=52824 RepID=A0A8X7SE70_BRACI|nr:hypothetical protein Bca52824_033368 [Brassica carinata]